MISEYNLEGPTEQITALIKQFDLRVIEAFKWDPRQMDVNVKVLVEQEDDLADACDALGVKHKFVGYNAQ